MDVSPSAASQLRNSAYIYPPVNPAPCFDRLPNLFSCGLIPRKLLLRYCGEMGYEVVSMLNVVLHVLCVVMLRPCSDSPAQRSLLYDKGCAYHCSFMFLFIYLNVLCVLELFVWFARHVLRQGIVPESRRASGGGFSY